MYLAWARRIALGVVLCSVAACGSSALTGDPTTPTSGAAIRFDVTGVLTALPRASIPVGILVQGMETSISVWLEGDYLDASLSQDQLTAEGGRAAVTLHAPSAPATFALRAKLRSGATARIDVSVSANGFGSVRIASKYAGTRLAPSIVGSVFLKGSCIDLARLPLNDGAPMANGTLTEPLLIQSVPAGSRVAIVVRVAHYAMGCVDIDALVPSVVRELALAIDDLPMALDKTNLDSLFTLEADAVDRAKWDTMLTQAVSRARSAFIPDGATESTVLLDAMQSLAPLANQPQFGSARSSGTFDMKTATWLGAHLPLMKDRATSWLSAGKADAFGDLTMHIGNGPGPGLAAIDLKNFGTLDAAVSGLSTRVPFGWTADPKDIVHLSGSVYVRPTALVTAAADKHARIDVVGSSNVASALATQIDCPGLATSLVGGGASYVGCNAACTASLCQAALSSMWKVASDASAAAPEEAQIRMTASAHADVGDYAEPKQFSGDWVGEVSAPGATFGLKGTATAPPR